MNKKISVSLAYDHPIIRVIQEAFTNAGKQSETASPINVFIDRTVSGIHLSIEDARPGQVEVARPARRERGDERLKLVGGRLFIESSANSGTTILVRIPWRPES